MTSYAYAGCRGRNYLRRISIAVIGIAAVIALFAWYFGLIKQTYDYQSRNDFFAFFVSSSEALKGANPYWSVPKPVDGCEGGSLANNASIVEYDWKSTAKLGTIHPNLNPPVWVALIMPFAHLNYKVAWVSYSLLSLSCALASLLLVSRLFFDGSASYGFLVVVLFICYFPTYVVVEYGQVTFFLLIPLVFSWLFITKGKERSCGFCLGLLGGLKPFFLLFAFGFFVCRKWLVLFGMALGFLVTVVVGGYFVGFEFYDDYLRVVSEVSWLARNWNASVFGFSARIMGAEGIAFSHYPPVAMLSIVASCLVVLAGLTWLINKPTANEDDERGLPERVYAGVIPSMLLLSPLGWLYYFPLMVIPVAIYCRRSKEMPDKRLYGLLMCLAWSMSALPSVLLSSCEAESTFEVLFRFSLPFYSLLMAFVLIVYVLGKPARPPALSS